MEYVHKEAKNILTYGTPMVMFAIFTVILIRLDLYCEGSMYSKQAGLGVRQDNWTTLHLLLYHSLILRVIRLRVLLHNFILKLSAVIFFLKFCHILIQI